jgi:voltage-gated potassium channel
MLALVIIAGTLGYRFIENWSWGDSFFMTIITVSTVGYGTIGGELSQEGMIFTSALIIVSFGTFAYAITTITSYIVSGDYKRFLQYRKLVKQIEHLHDHLVICGYGRVGRHAAKQLSASGERYVVIEKFPTDVAGDDIPVIEGDATSDDVLKTAGISRARALISTLPSDPDNLYVVLSARSLNNKLHIVARASSFEAVDKLKYAGANNVVMPDTIGGMHMASLVTSPDLTTFMERLSVLGEGDSSLTEVSYSDLLDLPHRTVGELRSQGLFGCMIIGLKTPEGNFVFNPADDNVIEKGAKIFVIGTTAQLDSMKKYLNH